VALLGFTLASLACGVAPGLGLLVAARLVQGLCAALLSPAALTLLSAVQGPDERRDSAVAVWTAVGAGGGASGWLVGGLLAEHADWRWVFLVNVPVGLVALALVRRELPAVPRRGGRDLDLPGALAATAGLALVVWGLTQVGGPAASPLAVVLPLVAGAAVLVWFHRHELRALQPLLPESLLADRATRGANLVALLSTAATTSAVVLAVLYLENVLRLPAGRAAWYFPAFNLTVVAGSLLGPRALRRAGARRVAMLGLLLVAVGTGVAPTMSAHLAPTVWLPVVLGLMGLGLGAAAVSATGVGLSRPATADRGVASGVLTSAAQVGNGVGFAFAVPFSTGSAVGGGLGTMGWGFLISAALAVLGACCARLLPLHIDSEQPERPRVQVGTGAGREWERR
jgi:MFS family permease